MLPAPRKLRCQTQTKVIQLKFEWTIPQFAFLKSFEKWGDYSSSAFFHEKDPSTKWLVRLVDEGSNNMKIQLYETNRYRLFNPVRVTIAILNQNREKIFPQQLRLPENTCLPHCIFQIEKTNLVESQCYVDGKITFDCEIEYLIPKDPALLGKSSTVADIHEKPFSNNDQLIAQLEGLYENMKFSDITVNVRGRQFKAHKSILAARSAFFAAMFEHPTKENLTNQIEVEDVEPDVFQEILRFIYTGKVSESKMEKMCVGILAVADKYLLDQLKAECETQLIYRMSTKNCLELLLFTEENHPAFHLRKYAVEFFRNFSSKVMATKDWEEAEQDHPKICFSVIKTLVKTV